MLARATAIQTMHAVVVWFVSSVLSLRRYPDVGAREGAALTIVESLTLHLPLPAQPYLPGEYKQEGSTLILKLKFHLIFPNT